MTESDRQFDALFDAHATAVLAYALRRTPTHADAEDAVSETFVVAWRRISAVPEGDQTLPWLLGVCRRILANQRRGTERRWRLFDRLRHDDRRHEDPAPDERGPAFVTLSRLRPDDQEVLRLVAWDGLAPAQIAVALGITPNAAAIRLHRARRRYEDEYRRTAEPEDLKEFERDRTSTSTEGRISGRAQRERST